MTGRRSEHGSPSRVLEVCVGSGRTSLPLLKTVKPSLVGHDFSKEMLRNAKAKTREFKEKTELVLGEAENLPFTDEAFDALICTSAMHYFSHPIRNLTEFSRTLRKRSIFVYGDLTLHESDNQRFLDKLEKTVSLAHGSYYKPSEIAKMLGNAGFRISDTVTFPYRKPLKSLMEDKARYFGVKPEALHKIIKNASEREREWYSISDNELTLFYTLIKALKE
jgi:ubiquinone/menaquinone biosynthesis C-methylase UbiE